MDLLVNKSDRILLKVTAVFPFNFFPDEIIIDETKVTIYHKLFFYTKQARSVVFEDILNVMVIHGIFFATLEVVDKYFSQAPIIVSYPKKKDAIFAKRVIQGIIIIRRDNIEVHNFPPGELLSKAEKIGKGEE